MGKQYLAIDLGGTEIKYSLMTAEAEVLEKRKKPTPLGSEAKLENLLKVLKDIITPLQESVQGIAISAPGEIDATTGYSYSGGAIWYLSEKNLPNILTDMFKIPATIENDGKAAALAELHKGSLKGVQNGAVILLGTGVGGGLIINGELYRGSHFKAGEISSIITNPFEGLGRHEFLAGNTSSIALINEITTELGLKHGDINGYQVFERANAGDQIVLDILNKYASQLVYQIHNLQAVLDLELIALGGGISRQPLLMELIQTNIKKFLEYYKKNQGPMLFDLNVTTCKFFNDSNLIGALLHHFDIVEK